MSIDQNPLTLGLLLTGHVSSLLYNHVLYLKLGVFLPDLLENIPINLELIPPFGILIELLPVLISVWCIKLGSGTVLDHENLSSRNEYVDGGTTVIMSGMVAQEAFSFFYVLSKVSFALPTLDLGPAERMAGEKA